MRKFSEFLCETIGEELKGQFAVGRRDPGPDGTNYFHIKAIVPDEAVADQMIENDPLQRKLIIDDETLPILQRGITELIAKSKALPKRKPKEIEPEGSHFGSTKYHCDDCGKNFMRHSMEGIRAGSKIARCRLCGSTNVHPAGQSNWWENINDNSIDPLAQYEEDKINYGFKEEDENDPNYLRYLKDKGHGPKIASCGHKVGSCRCSHTGDMRLAHYLDYPCPKCSSN